MDNPVFFTVLAVDSSGPWLTEAGLLGSRKAAETAATDYVQDSSGLRYSVAAVTLLDQDPVTGTPLPHLAPLNPTGFALASVSIADTSRRYLVPGPIYNTADAAHVAAEAIRHRNRIHGNDLVRDVVALTVI